MGRLSNRCTDWLRQHRGRTRWQFAGHTYEPTIPKPVSLDAPAAGDDGSTVGENVGRVDDDLEACFAAAASAGAGTLREQTPPTEPAQPSNCERGSGSTVPLPATSRNCRHPSANPVEVQVLSSASPDFAATPLPRGAC